MSKNNTATQQEVEELDEWKGDARLYELSPPLNDITHVVISAVDVSKINDPFFQSINTMTGGGTAEETLAFPCKANAKDIDMVELDGSITDGLDHERVLKNLGYANIISL